MGSGGSAVSGASVCKDRGTFLHWWRDDHHPGCVAVLDDFGGARNACISHEPSWAAEARFFKGADREDSSRVQGSAGFEDEYVSGAGEAEVGSESRGRCGYADP